MNRVCVMTVNFTLWHKIVNWLDLALSLFTEYLCVCVFFLLILNYTAMWNVNCSSLLLYFIQHNRLIRRSFVSGEKLLKYRITFANELTFLFNKIILKKYLKEHRFISALVVFINTSWLHINAPPSM